MGYGLLFVTVLAVVMQSCLAADVDCKKRPARINPATCCPMPELISDEIKEKCGELMKTMNGANTGSVDSIRPLPTTISGERPDRDGRPSHHGGPHGYPRHSCFMACALNETGIVSGMDGKLDEAKLSAYLKVVFKDSTELIPIVETSFKTCSAKHEKFVAKILEKIQNRPTNSSSFSTDMSQDRCTPFAGHLMRCVYMESRMNCPTSVWSNTKECNEMRDHIKNCKPKHGTSNEDSNSNSTEEDV